MLVNCVIYREGRRLKDIGLDEVGQWRRQPGTFVWVALHDATAEELAQVQARFDLHELAIEDVRKGNQRPKMEEYDDVLFVIMHLLEMEGTEINVGEVAIFVGEDFVLSIRSRCSQGFFGVRARAEREPDLLRHGPGYVFYALADAIVDRYLPIIDKLETQLEDVEAKIFVTGAARENVRELYTLKQKVMIIRHAIVPVIEGIDKLHGGRVPRVVQELGEYFRDVFDHLTRMNASLDSLRDTIGTAIQVNLSTLTIEETEITKRLAAWAGIFAVATAFAGIWGMNFEHMPELKLVWGYPAALVIIALACAFMWWRFRRAKWL